jgi:ketosteroid isomerase-like protein
MSASDVELVRDSLKLLSEGGVDAAAATFHPDFEFTTPPELASEPGTYHGEEGARAWFDSFYEAMDEVAIIPGELVNAGDGLVAGPFTLSARGRSTGLEFSQNAGILATVSDGKLRKLDIYPTLERALAAAGVGG